MKPALVIYAVMAFVWLCYASLHPKVHHDYSMLRHRTVGNITVAARVEHHDQRWRQKIRRDILVKQAAALRDIYHITDEDIAAPVSIFGE